MEDLNKQILVEIKGKTDNLKDEVIQLNKSLDSLKANQKALLEQGKKNSREYIDNATQIRLVTEAIRHNNKEIDNTVKALKLENGSLQQNRALLASLNAEYIKIGSQQGKMSKSAVEMAAKMNVLTERIKEQEKATGNHRSEVGNYGLAFDKVAGQMNSFGGAIGQAVNSLNMIKTGFTSAKEGSKSLDLALKATGFGFLIAILAAVINYLRKLDPVMDFIEKAFAGLGGAVDAVARIIVDFFTGIKSVGDYVMKMGNFLLHPIDSFKKLGTEMAKSAKEAYNLKGAMQDLADSKEIVDLSVQQMLAEANIQRLMARNRSLSAKERAEHLKKAESLERQAGSSMDKLYKDSLEVAIRHAQSMKKLTADDIKELRSGNLKRAQDLKESGKMTQDAYDALKQVYEDGVSERGRAAARLEKIITQQDAVDQLAAENREKLTAKQIAQQERLNAITEANYKKKLELTISNLLKEADLMTDTEKREFAKEKVRHQVSLQELKEYLGDNEEINKLVNRAIELENQQHEKNLKEIKVKGETERANVQTEANKLRLSKSQELNEETKRQDAALQAIKTENEEKAKKEAEDNQKELNDGMKVNAINAAKSLNDAIYNAKSDSLKRTAQREIDSAKANADTELGILQNKLDKGLLTEKEFADKKDALDKKTQAKILAEQKKAFEAEKKLKIKMTLINGALAVINAFATLSYPANIVAAAGVAAETGIQVGVIANQKFAKGGVYKSDGKGAVLPGYSKKDNINSMLREGEGVVVSEAMRDPWARNLVSAVNVMYGGRDFSTSGGSRKFAAGGVFNDGGYSGRYYSQQANNSDAMASSIATSILSNLPPIQVDVKEIYTKLGVLVDVQDRVNL